MRKVLIIGATSAIAEEVAKKYASEGAKLFLVARSEVKLTAVADDLRARGADSADIYMLDVNDIENHRSMLDDAQAKLGGLDIALIAHGTLPDQHSCEQDAAVALAELKTNGVSTIALLTELANIFETSRHGAIAVITSVAGDRGRPSNYLYGSAKALVSTFLEGLQARLYKSGVSVLDIKPGFVDTPMTRDLDLPSVLTVTPDKVAEDIVLAINRKRHLIYTPFFWRYIMLMIKSVPNFLFKRLSL